MRKTKISLVSSDDKNSFPFKEGVLKYFFSKTKLQSPKLLLLTTFHVDMEFIVNEVLSQVPYDCRAIIFYSPFTSNQTGYNIASERKDIRFVKARTTVFHPKFLLAISGCNALIGLGSANLTRGGWGGHNQELWHLYGNMQDELLNKHIPAMKNSISGFCNEYLKILMDHEVHPNSKEDRRILNNMKIIMSQITPKKKSHNQKNDPEIVHNYKKSFMTFIKERKIRNLRHMHIFSPIHFRNVPSEDEHISVHDQTTEEIKYDLFNDFIKLFPDRQKAAIYFYSSDDVDKSFQNGTPRIKFYKNLLYPKSHLKAIVFEKSNKKAYMLSGSANFSINAFRKRPPEGNSELMLYSDVTYKWPKLREVIIGKTLEEQKGVDYPEITQPRKKLISVIDQMDVFKISNKDSYEVHIYKNPKIESSIRVSIQYLIPNEEPIGKIRKLPKIFLTKPLTKILCNGQWKTLRNDRPLICSYKFKGFEFCFFVNYNFSSEDDENLTDAEREYADLFNFFGYRWEKGYSTTSKTAYREDGNEDDAEPENRYQSINDRFYHDWKHIYQTIKEYKNKKDMKLQYLTAKLKIKIFLDDYERNNGTSTEDSKLTPLHIKFIKERILTI